MTERIRGEIVATKKPHSAQHDGSAVPLFVRDTSIVTADDPGKHTKSTLTPRILVLDEHTVYRTGFRELIGAKVPRAEVIEASSLIQALAQLRSSTFDLVLVDLSSFGPLDSLKVAREASPATRFAIISASDTRAVILASLAAGFHGFISKHQSDTDIFVAITDILSGRIYVPGSLAEVEDRDALDGRLGGEEVPMLTTEVDLPKLTKRQREVLSLLAGGKSNKEIARVLDIAEATTKIHLAALVRALGVRNRTEAAFRAGKLVNFPGVACSTESDGWGSTARDEPIGRN